MVANKQFLQSLLLFLQFTLVFSLDIITTNQTFKEGDLLISRENIFAFGFFSPGNSSNRYLGIWYHKIPERSVVWVANRNSPVSGSSGILSINQNGNLVLYNSSEQKVPLWSANVSIGETDSCMVQLLDSGNLVLVQSRSKRIVWQSFDYPTDTLLPGMKFGLDQSTGKEWILTSWRSNDDPGTGVYSVKFNPRGIPQVFLYKSSSPIWRETQWPWRTYTDVYNYSIVIDQEELHFRYLVHDASIIFRTIVDESGTLKWLRWHASDGKWKKFRYINNVCDTYALCGAYSRCNPGNVDRFECSCLPGYEPKSPRDWNLRDASRGCVRKRLESSLICGHGEGFVKVGNVKFPDTSVAAFVGINMSRTECEHECLGNCSCSAYANIDNAGEESKCLAWYRELMDTVDRVDGKFAIYVRVDAIELAANAVKSKDFHKMGLEKLIQSVVLAWVTIIFIVYLWIRRKRVMKKKWEKRLFDPTFGSIYYKNTLVASELGQSSRPPDTAFFDLSIIVAATNNFSLDNKLGQGGFGSVYKVEPSCYTRKMISFTGPCACFTVIMRFCNQ